MQKRFVFLVTLAALIAPASAEQARPLKFDQPGNGKTLPVKRPRTVTSCAAYGAGFVKVAGTDTCVKVGGSIGVGVAGSVGR
ncbi:MAG TPA: porin [Bradyrhizobium sp.]|uniref:porin n=1 Tax=Bradyrhizobium sp. TaxID=376 RepID=UPI002C98AFEA|nr:porin [Bradyrhizobium sp.]HLZ03648.1 porin [Bradyrhizobium sp.]